MSNDNPDKSPARDEPSDGPKQAVEGDGAHPSNTKRRVLLAVAAVVVGLVLWKTMFRGDDPPPSLDGKNGESVRTGAGVPSELQRTNVVTPRLKRRAEKQQSAIAPKRQQWDSEVFSEAAEKQFKVLAKAIAHPDTKSLSEAATVAAEGFSCHALRPGGLKQVWQDHGMTVFRAAPAATRTGNKAAHRGGPGLSQAMRALAKPLEGAEDSWVKFKLISVTLEQGSVTTVCYYQAAGARPNGSAQQTATWRCVWRRDDGDAPPRLKRIDLQDYEEVLAKQNGGTLFADCTEAAIGHLECFPKQVRRGLNSWIREIERSYALRVANYFGLAVGDVNGDGMDDLYWCQPPGLPNRLFVRNAQGELEDRSHAAGVDWLDHTSSALLVDLDNDGDQDLVLAMRERLLLMANDGSGRFEARATVPISERDVTSLSAADYDNDGDVDVFVCVLRAVRPRGEYAFHDAKDGGANFLFRNDIAGKKKPGGGGAWRFTDVTDEVGLGKENYRQTYSSAWEDYDDDGDQDLYLANDYGPNQLFRNEEGRFVDVATEAGVTDVGSGMSVSWADFNRDGRMDLYVGNMFSSAGSRVTQQSQNLADASLQSTYRRFAKGNSLFENVGDGEFREVGGPLGVEMGRWAWSSLFCDVNNDGWEDLIVSNGFMTNDDQHDL